MQTADEQIGLGEEVQGVEAVGRKPGLSQAGGQFVG